MAGMIADNVEEEYLWATYLTSAKKVSQVWLNIECQSVFDAELRSKWTSAAY